MDGVTVIKPSVKMKKLYFVYLFVFCLFFVFSWSIPLSIFVPESIIYLAFLVWIPTFIIIFLFLVWLGKYYDSIQYIVGDEKIISRRGVWWKVESSVPLSKINNVKWKQGPFQRMLGLASLEFHTAAIGTPIPEISFSHVEVAEAERLRREILSRLGKALFVEKKEDVGEMFRLLLEEVRSIIKILSEKF